MNKTINLNGLYDGFLYRDKRDGQSDGFILEKPSDSPSLLLRRVYFKADEGYLVDHFVLSIFSRISAKAPESKVYDIKDAKNCSRFYLSTNGMTRSFVKNGILKRQIFTHNFPPKRELNEEQIKKFMVSLAKLRILIYVFGLGDLSIANIGYIYKDNHKEDEERTVKVGIVDFITPVTGRYFDRPCWQPPYSKCFPYGSTLLRSEFVERLNKIAPMFSRTFCGQTFIQSCGGKGEPVLNDYQQAMDEIRCPKVKEFDENGYLVSSSKGKKTKFENVLEEVFKDLKEECEVLWSGVERSPQNKSILFNLASDLNAIAIYKDIIKSRFLELRSIIVEKDVSNKSIRLVVAFWIVCFLVLLRSLALI